MEGQLDRNIQNNGISVAELKQQEILAHQLMQQEQVASFRSFPINLQHRQRQPGNTLGMPSVAQYTLPTTNAMQTSEQVQYYHNLPVPSQPRPQYNIPVHSDTNVKCLYCGSQCVDSNTLMMHIHYHHPYRWRS